MQYDLYRKIQYFLFTHASNSTPYCVKFIYTPKTLLYSSVEYVWIEICAAVHILSNSMITVDELMKEIHYHVEFKVIFYFKLLFSS